MDLRDARKKRGWSIEHVADLIGLKSFASVARHETGERYPRPQFIARYLAIYGGDVSEDDIRRTYMRAQRAAQSTPDRKGKAA